MPLPPVEARPPLPALLPDPRAGIQARMAVATVSSIVPALGGVELVRHQDAEGRTRVVTVSNELWRALLQCAGDGWTNVQVLIEAGRFRPRGE